MTVIHLLVLLPVAAICGAIGQALAGYSLGGCLISVVVGFLGAFIDLWLARELKLPEVFTISSFIKEVPRLSDHWNISLK